jgi:hypothetical protein
VVPDFSAAIDQLEISLSSNNGYDAPSPCIDSAAPWTATFADVPVGSWNISVVARSSGVQIGTGSVSNCTLTTAAPLAVTVPMTFNPVGTSGSVKFTVSFPASTGVDYVKGVIEETGAQTTPTVATADGTSSATFAYPSLATGTWSLVMTFRRGGLSGTIAGTFREKLIVIAGFESACWVDSSGALVSGGRAFDATEFFDTNISLGGLDIAGILPGTAFSSGSFTYALGLITGLSSTVSFTATESVEGQYLQYSWNSGAWTEVRSGTTVSGLALSESNTLVVRVTAPDHQTPKPEDYYTVTFTKGYRVTYNGNGNTGGSAPVDSALHAAGTVGVLGPGSLSRSGYAFLGWATSAGAEAAQYAEGQSLPVSADVTLYAVWEDIPPDVTNLTATAGTGSVTLTWTDPAVADLAKIRIEYSGGGPIEVGSGVRTATISGLADGQIYTFAVKAIDTTGVSSAGVTIPQAVGTLGDGSYSFAVPGGTVGFTVSGGAISITSCSSGVTSIDIPSQIGGVPVTVIAANSLIGCPALTHLTLPPTLLTISAYAIRCSALPELVIPSSVTYLGGYCLSGCSSLISVTIPASVTTVREVPFENCSALQEINVDPANTVCSSQGGVLFDKNGATLLEYPAGKAGAYTIPSSCNAISYGAFRNTRQITLVVIPATVTSIGSYAFMSSSKLAEVDIYTINPPSVDSQTFAGNAGGRIFKVPAASLAAYKTAWSAYASSIQAGTW